jgi:hypothetical protein
MTETPRQLAAQRLIDEQRREADKAVERLHGQAERVKARTEDLIANLDQRGREANINELGELQGSGVELDRLCGEFGVHVQVLGRMEAAESFAAEQEAAA